MVHTKADSGGFHAQTGKYGSLHNILAFKVVFVTSFPLFGPEKQGNRKQLKILHQETLQREQNSATHTRSIPLSGKLEETKNRRTRKR